jgi:hypothetical protein
MAEEATVEISGSLSPVLVASDADLNAPVRVTGSLNVPYHDRAE